VPYCLPIFGKYNDYGGIEDIITDFNTKLIEEIHNCSIEDFCSIITGSDEEEIEEFSKELTYVKEHVNYMWIHLEVYNFLANDCRPITYRRAHSLDFGKRNILEKMGFTYAGETEDKRYKHAYTIGEYVVHSDGEWCHLIKGANGTGHNYGLHSLEEFEKHIPTCDVSYFRNKEDVDICELYNFKERFEHLHFVLGYSRTLICNIASFSMSQMTKKVKENVNNVEVLQQLSKEMLQEKSNYAEQLAEMIQYLDSVSKSDDQQLKDFEKYMIQETQLSPMQLAYFSKLDDIYTCQCIGDLIRLMRNGVTYSTCFKPYKQYITPQCGEHKTHQMILEKFVEINKTFLK